MEYEGNVFVDGNFKAYQSVISEMKPRLKRVCFWAVTSCFYAWSGLRLKDGEMDLWGVSIEGITETLLIMVLVAFTFYFSVAYFWNFFLKCRELSEGYLQALRKTCCVDSSGGDFELGFASVIEKAQNKNALSGTLRQFGRNRVSVCLVCLELFVLPLYVPAVLSVIAITSLLFRKVF